MTETKSFDISQRLAWAAYKRVKANKGAAWVDRQSMAEFELSLSRQSLPDLESHVFGKLFPAASECGCYS